jgi:hypothetical protein
MITSVESSQPAKGLKKVSLAGIAKKKDDTSNKYPVYPDPDGKAAELSARIAHRREQFDALKSALEVDKAELGQTLIRPWYFRHHHRKAEAPSSVLVDYTVPADIDTGQPQPSKGTLRITVKEQYAKFPNEEPFAAILGDQVAKYFRQSFDLQIDGDKLPTSSRSTGRRSGRPGVMVHVPEDMNALLAELGLLPLFATPPAWASAGCSK